MADNDDHGGPPPGWPDKSEIYAEAANMVAMVADRRAMSEILDALRSEQESERQQGERDLRARLERAVQLESGPDAIVEVSGGTDYPVRLARMLQAQERFSAAFGLVVFEGQVSQLDRFHDIGSEVIELARSLGPPFEQRTIDWINLRTRAADRYSKVLEEVGQGRGASAVEAFAEELRQVADGRLAAEVSKAAAISEPAENNTLAALAEAGSDREKVRAILTDPAVPVRERLHAATVSANKALRDRNRDLSLLCAEIEVDLVSERSDRGADLPTTEHQLAAIGSTGPATYVGTLLNVMWTGKTLADGREPPWQSGYVIDRMAALADGARGLTAARQFESRPDLTSLEAARPDLAEGFRTLTCELRADPDVLAERYVTDPPPPPTAAGRDLWARSLKLTLSGELDALIERIRAESGFEGFLRRLSPVQLRAAASAGPLVLLVCPDGDLFRHTNGAVTPFALVITEREIRSIRLNIDLSVLDAAAARWSAAIAGLGARGAARPSPERVQELARELTAILSLTWHDVVSPVLRAVGLTAPVAGGGPWPRLWWIPEGPLHTLPLHAAQCRKQECERDGCGAALDNVASSYLPSVRTLAHIRARDGWEAGPAAGRAGRRQRALLVAAADADLPYAQAAARRAAGQLRRAGYDTGKLIGPAATKEAVLAGLVGAAWAHFGCHATSDPLEPSGGRLQLPSGEALTVGEVSAARSEAARVAFLAACSTARAPQRLPGQAIHLSSAFLLAGFSAAIGTLWEVDSEDAHAVTRDFYAKVRVEPRQSPALALHHAVRELRAQHPDSAYSWAAYVYSGA